VSCHAFRSSVRATYMEAPGGGEKRSCLSFDLRGETRRFTSATGPLGERSHLDAGAKTLRCRSLYAYGAKKPVRSTLFRGGGRHALPMFVERLAADLTDNVPHVSLDPALEGNTRSAELTEGLAETLRDGLCVSAA
jgi:hypothetical protein